MPCTHILQRLYSVEMLRSRCDVEPLIVINASSALIDIIRIGVVHHRVNDIHINATGCVDDIDKSLEPDPGIMVNGDTIILLYDILHMACRAGNAVGCIRSREGVREYFI